ncbi:hypothetical protein HAX54_029553 [Datura stramonium]|uniref:Secreted protein n=1 Tax=Datura stramonium TaxID=4076 RepID=A0ABS8SAB0_DATST|nr:hypothetical protein [Datura stramonium]
MVRLVWHWGFEVLCCCCSPVLMVVSGERRLVKRRVRRRRWLHVVVGKREMGMAAVFRLKVVILWRYGSPEKGEEGLVGICMVKRERGKSEEGSGDGGCFPERENSGVCWFPAGASPEKMGRR